MPNVPLFQGIQVPTGLQARILQDIKIVQNSMTVQEFNTYIQNLFYIVITGTGIEIVSYLPPNLTAAATNSTGSTITLTFDKAMIDPAGKEAEFSVTVDDVEKDISSIALTADTKKYLITMSADLDYSDTVVITYTRGTIKSLDGGAFMSLTSGVTRGIAVPPTLVAAETSTNGLSVILTFNKDMSDPSGKHEQFIIKDQTVAKTVSSAAIDTENSKNIILTMAEALTPSSIITVNYTKGTVNAVDDGKLQSFNDTDVVNNVVIPYQDWSGYPDSPVLTQSFPYQAIAITNYDGGKTYLYVSPQPMYHVFFDGTQHQLHQQPYGATLNYYKLEIDTWTAVGSGNIAPLMYNTDPNLREANKAIYTDTTLSNVYFAQTTP